MVVGRTVKFRKHDKVMRRSDGEFYFFKVTGFSEVKNYSCCNSGYSIDHVPAIYFCALVCFCSWKTIPKKVFENERLIICARVTLYLWVFKYHVTGRENGHLTSYLKLFEQRAISTQEFTLLLPWKLSSKLPVSLEKGSPHLMS